MNTAPIFACGSDILWRGAHLSDCGRYRYSLKRWWDDELPWACWIMLNPSTADAAKDDPTIRRCISFSRRWGMGGLIVLNLFAWRATDPNELAKAADPIGPLNDLAIRAWADVCRGPIIAAWGARLVAVQRAETVLGLLGDRPLMCLGTTKAGRPRHPLYTPDENPLVRFAPTAKEASHA